jgi:orotate phosphoribosyltransferase-like protein
MATAVDLSTQAGQLYTSGLAVEAIAKELSVTYRTARKAVQLSGVELRDPSERLKGRTRKSPLA